jgi:tRNA(fMet)-specific endonuclease VapC
MYLIDTNILNYFIKQNSKIIDKFDRFSDKIVLSTAVEMECYFGVAKNDNVELEEVYNDIFATYRNITIDSKVARIFGKLKALCRKTGKNVEDFDLIIASQALVHDLILVTNNTKHFENIKGLKLENWTK